MRNKKKIYFSISFFAILIALSFLFKERIYNYIKPLKIKNIDLVHVPQNRLRFKLNVTTNRSCDAVVKYWAKNSKDTLYTAVSEGKSKHTLWIVNTLGRTEYTFQVISFNAGSKTLSKKYPFETKTIYQATPYFSMEYMDEKFSKEMNHKYFLTQILSEPGSAVILDHKGNIVWYEAFKKGAKVTHWTPQKTILCILGSENIPSSGGDEIMELSLSGEILTHFQLGKGEMDKMVHHEVRVDDQGNIYALTFDKKVFDLSSVGGSKQDTVNADGIVIFNRAGKKLWEWSVLDHLDPLAEPNILKLKKDWVHANSVFREKDGNFLISYRDLNQVWRIDFKTGKVLWKFGEKGDFKLDDENLFSSQHFAHINERNELMILDNGTKKGITRALSFQLNEEMQEAIPKINISLPKDYYTTAKGNAQLLNGNKVLFSLTDPRAFLITDLTGTLLWKLNVGGDPYRIEEAHHFLYDKPVFNAD
jgi:arylsulfate sulfotransferase